MAGRQRSAIPAWFAPLPAAGVLVGALLLLAHLRRQRWLLTEGRAAFATVTRHSRCAGKHKNTARVHYDFKLLDGSHAEGRYMVQKSPPEVGSRIIVLYDRDEPARQARYPLPLVRVRMPAQ